METLGGAAAITGLFQAVLASYSFWDRCRKYGTESNIVLNMLKIEEARFRLWGEKWSLDTSSGQKFFEEFHDQPHVVALVKQSLEQLRLLFEGAQKWGERLEQATANKVQYHAEAEQVPARVDGSFTGRGLKSLFNISSRRKLRDTASVVDSVKWALPGGKEQFEVLITNIRETTNTLCDITKHQVLEELLAAVVFHNSRSLEQAGEMSEATINMKPLLHMISEMRTKVAEIDLMIPKTPFDFGHRRELGRDKTTLLGKSDEADVALQARFNRWREDVRKDFWEYTAATKLSVSDLDLQRQSTHSFQTVRYDRSIVLVRWVQDTFIFWGGGKDLPAARLTEIQREHHRCVAAVASQLHHIHHTQWKSGLESQWIRTLDCIGYLFDELQKEQCDKFSYAFLLPSHLQTAEDVTCATLRDCLQRLQEPPDLFTRKNLARALSRTVFGIHLAGLLHKSFNPDNVIFIGQRNDFDGLNVLSSLGEPYVVGFELARPLCKPEFSVLPVETDIYTHPAYNVMTHFNVFFDLHSLGLVLLSVGLWRTLESFWDDYLAHCDETQEPRPYPSLDYQDLFSTAKENGHKGNFASLKWSFVEYLYGKIDSLSTSCGMEWADAVRWCTKDAWKKEYSEKRFLEQVVHVFD